MFVPAFLFSSPIPLHQRSRHPLLSTPPPTCSAATPRRPRPAPLRRALAAAAVAALLVAPLAADAAADVGADVFEASCAACHAGGGNVIGFARKKTLKAAALEKYGFNTKASIVRLLREGKGVMPPYGLEKLSDVEVDGVAEFVLSAAQRGWK
jgi:cytochrome c6